MWCFFFLFFLFWFLLWIITFVHIWVTTACSESARIAAFGKKYSGRLQGSMGKALDWQGSCGKAHASQTLHSSFYNGFNTRIDIHEANGSLYLARVENKKKCIANPKKICIDFCLSSLKGWSMSHYFSRASLPIAFVGVRENTCDHRRDLLFWGWDHIGRFGSGSSSLQRQSVCTFFGSYFVSIYH